jgi:cytochrome c oxidase cbb3-type subunit 3
LANQNLRLARLVTVLMARERRAMGAPNLTDDVWLHGYGEAAIIAMINGGKSNQMPAQAGKLTQGQIHILTSYVWGLSNKGGAVAK